MAANWRIKRNFSLRGEEGPWPWPGPDLTWSDLGRPGDPPGITRPQLYKYIRASRARIRSFLGGVSPGVCAVCFLGRLAPFAALALVLFSSLFFLSIFLIFLIFQCLHRAGHRAGVGVFFWFG